jgi:hypothetical protein
MRVGIVEPAEDVYSYSSAQQAVSIPADAAGVTLRFHLFPISGEASAAVGFRAPPVVGAMEEAVLSDDVQYVLVLDEDDQQLGGSLIWQKSDSREWTFHTFDLSEPPYAGRTVKLTFGVYNDGVDGVTGMYVDDVSLVVCDASP